MHYDQVESAGTGRRANEHTNAHAIVLFDGVCNLCNGAVLFVIDRDHAGYFKFAALQSDEGRRLLGEHSYGDANLGSMVLIEEGKLYTRSSAALRIARGLPGSWRFLSVLRIVPRPLRDAAYDFIADHRYRWFGKEELCRVLTPELRRRFL